MNESNNQNQSQNPCRSQHNPQRRRGPRLARFLIVLAAFAATTAGLHALSDHYGWRHHGGPHHVSSLAAPNGPAAPSPQSQPALAQPVA